MNLFVMDGSAYIHRAYHAAPPFVVDGVPVGAIMAFSQMLWGITNSREYTHVVCVLDAPGRNWRHDILPSYKANRPPKPDDLRTQIGMMRDCLEAFGVQTLEVQGFEADDLIATVAPRFCRETGGSCVIGSSDKDLLQVIDAGIAIWDPMKGETLGVEAAVGKFGVPPCLISEVQGLSGDPVDGVPGVQRVGIKTAAQLINRFGSIEGVYANIDEVDGKALRRNLMADPGIAYVSRQLVSLRSDVPLTCDWSTMALYPRPGSASAYCASIGLNHLADRIMENTKWNT